MHHPERRRQPEGSSVADDAGGPPGERPDVAAYYRQRAARFGDEARRLARIDRLLGFVRLAVFLVAAGLLLLGAVSGVSGCYVVGGAVALGFVAVVSWHDAVCRELEEARAKRAINIESLARLERRWDDIPLPAVEVPAAHGALSNDLDLFGHASLFQLLCCASTPVGVRVLRDWLLHPAPPDEIKTRQLAVVELAPRVDLREQLLLEGRLLAGGGDAVQRFLDWAESPTWLARRPWLTWTCRLLPAAATLVALLVLARLLPIDIGAAAVLATCLLNFLISVVFTGRVHDIFNCVTRRRGEPQRYVRMFELLADVPAGTSKLAAIQHEITELGGGVLPSLRQLNRILGLANISHSPLFYIVVYLPLQLFTLYDFHILGLLERWQQRHGQHVRQWLEALGQFEALASLAMLRADHPGWVLPEVDVSAESLRAEGLGHPLLSDTGRVANEVQVGPLGTFLLVTGSNMSGKSTLLRSIGVNAVLAQAGGPVCARQLTMPPVELTTSMRIHDSLEDGVSFFMAELKRLKQIVDRARQLDECPDRTLLYLLDEILQGTNSTERHIAVVRVLSHLLEHRAIGAVSTHDLALASSQPLAGCCQAVHFRETLHDGPAEQRMTFDYLLRPGVATTTNALKLLNIVGLGEP